MYSSDHCLELRYIYIYTFHCKRMLHSPFMNLNPCLHYRCFVFSSPSFCLCPCSVKHPSASMNIYVGSKAPPPCFFYGRCSPSSPDQYLHPSYFLYIGYATEIISSNWMSVPAKSFGDMFMLLGGIFILVSLHPGRHIIGKSCFVDL